MFNEDDVAKLAAVAERRLIDAITANAMAWKLNDAFMNAITWETLDRRNSPPAKRRDYLNRIAQHVAALIDALGIETLGERNDVPNQRDLQLSHGFRHLSEAIDRMADPDQSVPRASCLARAVAPDFNRKDSELRQTIRAARRNPKIDPIANWNSIARGQLSEAAARGMLALPMLLDIARYGRDHWAAKKAQPGERQDSFRRTLMADLAGIYLDCYGTAPDVTDAQRGLDGAASAWIYEVIAIANERQGFAPVAADDGDVTPEDAAAMIRDLAAVRPDTLARYFLDGWNTFRERRGRRCRRR